MRIDAHHHFWKLSRGDYAWLTPDLEPLYRDFGPEHLQPLLADAGIDATVLVQAADTVAETEWLLDTGSATPFVGAVVGWVDMDQPDRARFDIDRLVGHPLMRGIRPMMQDLEDDEWMLREAHEPVLVELVRRGLTFDALVKPRHLPALEQFVGRYPSLQIIIDHGAKPNVARPHDTAEFAAWAASMHRLAAADNTVMKLSGLVTEASDGWDVATLRPYFDELLDAFGPERLLWGSDWPVVTCAATYRQWVEATAQLLAGLDDAARDRILGGTAAQVYRITA